MTSFGGALRGLRKRVGLSLADVGLALGVSAQYVSLVEAGERGPFKREDILVVARLLNADPVVLLKHAIAETRAVTLPVSGEKRRRVATLLACVWDNLSSADLDDLERVLRRGNQ
jgi:transcriptional regulator with XRE-family HTH domain